MPNTGRHSYTPDISNNFRPLPTISRGGDPCTGGHSSSEGRQIESVALSVASLTSQLNTLPIPPLVHLIGCRRYVLVLRQFQSGSLITHQHVSLRPPSATWMRLDLLSSCTLGIPDERCRCWVTLGPLVPEQNRRPNRTDWSG